MWAIEQFRGKSCHFNLDLMLVPSFLTDYRKVDLHVNLTGTEHHHNMTKILKLKYANTLILGQVIVPDTSR